MKFENPKWKFALSFGELKHYKDDVYYNVDGAGEKRYWKDGNFHRDDGPAIERLNGNKEWYTDGIHNRLDGPAIEYCDGTKAYFICGVKYTEEDFNHVIELKKDPKWNNSITFPISILTAAVIAKSFLANNKDNNKQIISKENVITTQNTNS